MLKYQGLKQAVIKKSLFTLLLITGNWAVFSVCAQIVVFQDSFSGQTSSLLTTAMPSLTYVSNVPLSNSGTGRASVYQDNILLLERGTGTSPVANLSFVSGPSSNFLSPYNTTLAYNTQVVMWNFNMRYNRASRLSGTSLAPGNTACAVILACDNEDPTAEGVKGYGVFYLGAGTTNSLYLIYFKNGISGVGPSDTENQTVIAKSALNVIPADASVNYLALKITYNPVSNSWQLSYRVDTNYTDPTTGSFTDISATENDEGTAVDMPHFAFASSYSTTSGNAFFDNFRVTIEGTAPELPGETFQSKYVTANPDSSIAYVADEKGNTIPDFSNVGYHHGYKEIPTVNVVKTVEPVIGDAGEVLQAAINEVAGMTPDENGIRGAILIKKGDYLIADSLVINASGIILRGEGNVAGGTRLIAAGTSDRTLITVSGTGSITKVANTEAEITDSYVPCGAKSFNVSSAAGLKVGDPIIVYRPGTAEWIHDIKMDQIVANERTIQWNPSSFNIISERKITAINGNRIYIDNPVVMTMEDQYGGGEIYKYTYSGRLTEVGIENILFESEYASETDEAHSWDAINFDHIENGWVRNITAYYFAGSAVRLDKGAKNITVTDSKCFDAKSQITGMRRYSFYNRGQQNLFMNLESREGRHDYVTGGVYTVGPNVFYNCKSTNAKNDIGPHQLWNTGTLYDNIETDGPINVQDRGNSGTGHGWAGANQVLWNCKSPRVAVQSPWVSAKNYAIGIAGGKVSGTFPLITGRPDGEWDGLNATGLHPASLFVAQRLARTLLPPTQTIVFNDGFTGTTGTLQTSATPSLTYVSNVSLTSSSEGRASVYQSSILLIERGTGTTPAPVSNLAYVSGSSSNFLSPYNTTLANNTHAITWNFNMRYNRTSRLSASLASGNPACAVILACDKEDPTAAGAKGYGIFYLGNGSNNAVFLIYFQDGISGVGTGDTETQTVIAKSANVHIPADASLNYLALKVTYNPPSNSWQLSYRVDTNLYTNPIAGIFRDIAPVVNNAGTAINMPYFAFASSYSATSGNAFFDNFTVTVDNVAYAQTLPVELTSFTATKTKNGAELKWQTASEQNNSHFEILRSAYGKDFVSIGTVNGSGNSALANSYSYQDNNPLSGYNYYMLKQVDNDGEETLYKDKIQVVNNTLTADDLQLRVVANTLMVSVGEEMVKQGGNLYLYNTSGQLLYRRDIFLSKDNNQVSVDLSTVIPTGVFVARVTLAGQSKTIKFFKQ